MTQLKLKAGSVLTKKVTPSSKLTQVLSELNYVLLNNADYVLHDWLPDGSLSGKEYKSLNPRRDDTSIGSFSINTESGKWADFATNDSGNDLPQLYGYLNEISETEELAEALTSYCEEHDLTAGSQKGSPLDIIKKEKPPTEVIPADEMNLLPPDFDINGNAVTGTWEYRTPQNEVLFYVLRADLPDGGKETKPCRISKGKWVWSYPDGKFPLYNLHKFTAGATILFGEGEKVATHLDSFSTSVGMTSAGGSNRLFASDLSPLKKAGSVIIFPDADAAGQKYAMQVQWYCVGAGIDVTVLDTDSLGWKNGEDCADHPELGFEDYAPHILTALEWREKHEDIADEALYAVIGGITPAEYDRMLDNFATQSGISKRTLNNERKARLKGNYQEEETVEEVSEAKQKMLDFFGVPEIADEEQSTDLLLQEIVDLIERHVALQRYQTVAIAVWILSSYLYDSFNIFARLGILSPMKRCGKTTLLETIAGICNKPLPTANISAAAVFRTLETYCPTLMIDEADILLGRDPNSELIGILNSGHIRSACVIRLVGDTHEPQRFSVWSPVIFASIRDLPNDALMDRTLAIRLERRKQEEKLQKLPITHKEDCAVLRSRLLKWANDNEAIVKASHILPPEIANDRAMDNWLPLFTVAGLASDYWQTEVEASYKALNQYTDDEALHNLLLKDIRAIFEQEQNAGKSEKISSSKMITHLLRLEHRPWGEIQHGRSLTAHSLAKMLKDFQIEPKVFRDGEKTSRGYAAEMFSDVFERYL
jgi:hypothetical protein